MTKLGIAGIVARFKPVHKGHAAVLEALCERSEHVYIGIGSSNRYNLRNPFTKEEMDEALQYPSGLFGVHYRHPELDSLEARRKYRAFKKLRPGSADLDYSLRICYNIIFRGLRSR